MNQKTSRYLKRAWSLYVARGVYVAIVGAFWYASTYPASAPPVMQRVLVGCALLLLPFAILSSRFKRGRDAASEGLHIFAEVMVALATSILLVGVQDLIGPEHAGKQFAEKMLETSVIFIVVFALQTVTTSVSLFAPALREMREAAENAQQGSEKLDGAVKELEGLSKKLYDVGDKLETSGEQIKQARYAGLAARVIGIKNRDSLMIPGVKQERLADEDLARIGERALDSFQAWIQTGFRIDTMGAGGLGRQTWWRLMEAYHHEEVFDVTQREVATNVRNFAMMLLLAIGYQRSQLKDNQRLVLANVSKFPPKDFYNFPDGSPEKRFYHEPEFFGTYRRALGSIAKHPQIWPIRVFLCGPGDQVLSPDELARFNSNGASSPSTAVGMDPAKKLADDCAVMSFLPVPLTFPYLKDAPNDDEDAEPKSVAYFKRRCVAVFAGLPRGVDRALITPFYRWVAKLKPGALDPDPFSNLRAIKKLGFGDDRAKFNASFDTYRAEAAELLATGLDDDPAKRALPGHEAANFKGQLDDAWDAVVRRCLGFGWSDATIDNPDTRLDEARIALKNSVEHGHCPPGSLAASLDSPVNSYEEEYHRYVEEVATAHEIFNKCLVLTNAMFKPNRPIEFDAHQADLVEHVLALLAKCQKIDSFDKFFELITTKTSGPRAVTASTGLKLGYAENWLHRVLVYLEGRAVLEDVKKHGPIPLWKLVASDLCGISDQTLDVSVQFSNFIRDLTKSIRVYDSHDDQEAVLNEFMLLGVAECTDDSKDVKAVDLTIEEVRWKALIGTRINEPFHTCRIQFDFGDYSLAELAAGTSKVPAPSAVGQQGFAVVEHAQWLAKVWRTTHWTDLFREHLEYRWGERQAANAAPAPPGS